MISNLEITLDQMLQEAVLRGKLESSFTCL